MSAPTLTSIGGLYRFRWDEEQVIIHLDRLYEDSKYQVTCEIQINTTAPGSASHLHGGSRLNLTSTESRRRLAKYLNEYVSPNNWTAILEQASVMALTEWRKGSPIIEMSKYSRSEGLKMRVAPLFQELQPSVLFGEGETFKSFFATFIAVLIRTGINGAGLTPEPGNTLCLDYETDEDTFKQRLEMVACGLGVDVPDGIFYRHMDQPVATDIKQVSRMVLDKQIAFAIIDSAAHAVIEPESAAATTEYFRGLRGLHITTLTIAHVTKHGKNDYPFGSSFWRNIPRSLFLVRASREAEHVTIGLKHVKSNNGRRLKDMGFQFEFDGDDRLVVTSISVKEVPELARGLPLRERITSALSRGAKSLSVLSEELEEPATRISIELSRNQANFQQIGRGTWGLKSR